MEQNKITLNKILEQLSGNEDRLKDEALELASEILSHEPDDIDTRLTRIKLYIDLFNDPNSALLDAKYISRRQEFRI